MTAESATLELKAAVMSGDTDEIHNQLNAGADINTRDSKGMTMLQHAIFRNKNDAVEVLLERGADPELPMTGEQAYTALHVAAQCANEAATKLLLQYRVEPDVLDAADETPLHVAASVGALAVAKALIEAGADIISQDKNKQTPRDVATHMAANDPMSDGKPQAETAEYLKSVEVERGLDRESEMARKAKVAGDIAVLRSHHPERYKIKLAP